MATFYNQATLSYNGIVKASNITSGEIMSAVSVTKTPVSAEYSTGSSVTYIVNIVNSGSVCYENCTLTDDLGMYAYGVPKADGPANYVRRTSNLSRMEYKNKWRAFVDKGWILPSDFDRECKDVAEFDCEPTGYSDTSTICPLNVKRDGKSDVMFHLENFLAAVRGEAELNAPAEQVFTSMVVAFGAIRSASRRETVYFKPEDFTP